MGCLIENNVRNPRLYHALEQMSGQVVIHNEGMAVELRDPVVSTPATRQQGEKFISSEQVVHGGEYYAINCPFCGDTRQRLYFSHAWNARMQVDGLWVRFSRGLAICYNENCLHDRDNRFLIARTIENAMAMSGGHVTIEATHSEGYDRPSSRIELPTGLLVNETQVPSYVTDYLHSRYLDPDELARKWQVQVAMIPIYNMPALLLPVYHNRELMFWQARYIGECRETFAGDGKTKPRYFNPSASKKSWNLYNLDLASRSSTVVLVEGIFDVFAVGDPAVAMFGKKPSTAQERMLFALWRHGKLIWIPDRDDPEALGIARERVEEWNLRGFFEQGAHILELPSGDPGDYKRSQLWSWLEKM